jgi:RNA polymerase sigma-70 factor (ECF subfamily)
MSRGRDFTRLFAQEAPKLRRFLRRYGSAVSPEDITQESFERLYSAQPEGSSRIFLFRTARNLAIDTLRREAIAPVRNSGENALEARSGEPDPEQRLLVSEAVQRLQGALAKLPEHKRAALLLFKLERHSYREIGARLGVSPRTVERYVADAIAHCHKELRDLREE